MLLVSDVPRLNADKVPDKTAIVFKEAKLTWREVEDQSNSFANALLDLGLVKGDAVGLLARNCHQWVVAYFGLVKAGCIVVPINFRLSGQEVVVLLRHCEVKAVIAALDFQDLVDSIKPSLSTARHFIAFGEKVHSGWLSFDKLLAGYPPVSLEAGISEDDLLSIIYTSGTTGTPKGVMHTHRSFLFNALQQALYLDRKEDDIALIVAALSHSSGLQGAFMPVACVTGTSVLMDHFDAEVFMQIIEVQRITTFIGFPLMFRSLCRLPDFDRYDISSLRNIEVSGAVLPVPDFKEAMTRFKVDFFHALSSVEAGLYTTLNPKEQWRKVGSVGRPFFGVEVKIVDDQGQQLATGEVGEIVVRGDNLMKGYYRLPEQTREALDEQGWHHTGDLGKKDEEGFLYVGGRKKDMIKCGGESIYPEEIESVLVCHPKVLEAAVIGIPHETLVEAIHAVVVLKPEQRCNEEDIIAFCKQRLGSYKKPASVEFVEFLPRNPSGAKILKSALRDKYWKVKVGA